MEKVEQALKSLSISYKPESHAEVDSFKSWVDTVKKIDGKLGATKTLVLKPSKGANSNPIIVIALDTTEFSVGTLAKSLGNKDARVAQDDLVKETFGIDKINITPFSLEYVQDKATVTVVVDQNIVNNPDLALAFRGFSGSHSFVVSSSGLKKFLDVHGGEYKVIDLSNLVVASPPPSKKEKPAKEQKESEGSQG
jgi:prolyl-tRNA synthetase